MDSAETVNGGIGISEEVIASGAVSTVNGDIAVDAGSEIERNGEILLENPRIGGDLETANGGITSAGATVEGDIIIADQRGWRNKFFSGNSRPLKLVIDEKSSA